jgi:hypothetical protein
MREMIEQVERRFRAPLESLATDMRRLNSEVGIAFYSEPVGTLTSYQGHQLGLEAHFPSTPESEHEAAVLAIELCHLTTTPRIMASAAGEDLWEYTSNTDWPVATPERLQEISENFERLCGLFRAAVAKAALPTRDT